MDAIASVIRSPLIDVEHLLGAPDLKPGKPCRINRHLLFAEVPEGTLVYHGLTKAVLQLSAAGAEALSRLPCPYSDDLASLVQYRIVVSEDTDEAGLCDGIRAVLHARDTGSRPLTSYTIYTTTDCNARCFYCFEAGARSMSMTEADARTTAEFIRCHCSDSPVTLHWFGGEPLVNPSVIDVICSSLRCAGVKYRSDMTTNGLLFDADMVRKASDIWHLHQVQITLDGTEQVYNARKAYVHPKGSPYLRVLDNIELLTEAGIRVNIRLNTDLDNAEDMAALIQELSTRFGGNDRIRVFAARLLEDVGRKPFRYREDQRAEIESVILSLQRSLVSLGFAPAPSPLPNSLRLNQCMADSEASVIILPDGRLGRCKSFCDRESFGDIFTHTGPLTIPESWQQYEHRLPECPECSLYSDCLILRKCPNRLPGCSLNRRKAATASLKQRLIHTYQIHTQQKESDL